MPARKPRRTTAAPSQDPPTVVKVRAIRRRMWQEAGGDIKTLMELARRDAARLPVGKRVTPKRRSRGAA